MKIQKFPLILIIALTAVPGFMLHAGTVMISYDLVLDVHSELISSRYIRETSVDVESGIMDDLFDKGHIVFNAPGEIYEDSTQLPGEAETQSLLARRSRIAREGGADTLIYLRLFYDGQNESSIHLTALEYEIIRVRDAVATLADSSIEYEVEPPLQINGYEASRIFLNRIASASLF